MAKGSKTIWITSVCLLFFCVSCSFANNVNVPGIVGDNERFTCEFLPDSESKVNWMCKFTNGTSVFVEESEMLKSLETFKCTPSTRIESITSLILLRSHKTHENVCERSDQPPKLDLQDPRFGPDEMQLIQQILTLLDSLSNGDEKEEPWSTLISMLSIVLILFVYYRKKRVQQSPQNSQPPEETEMNSGHCESTEQQLELPGDSTDKS